MVSVSFLVSFGYVQNRSARITQDRRPRSRTSLNFAGPGCADLESVWGQRSLTTATRATD